ncbi:MAG: hypothetical protein ACHQFW_10430 [Chitinophagales bacterium]
MENIHIDKNESEKLTAIVGDFFVTSPVPTIELLNKCFSQTDDTKEKLELLRVSKLILNLYEVVTGNEIGGDKGNDIVEGK